MDESLRPLAETIRAAYIAERRRWEEVFFGKPSYYQPGSMFDGGEHRGRNYKNVWFAIAEYFQRKQIKHPQDFIHAQFAQGGLSKPPQPNQLVSDTALTRYRKRPQVADLLERELRSQADVASTEIKLRVDMGEVGMSRATWDVLTDSSLPLTALFRYCLALSMAQETGERGWNHLARALSAPAITQFRQDADGYRAQWKTFLPKSLLGGD